MRTTEAKQIKTLNSTEPQKKIEVTGVSFCGPLPPPQILDGYEKACPGSANRIIKMAEKEAGHRHKMEHKMIFDSLHHEKLGIVLGFVLSLPAMGVGIYFLCIGNNAAGSIAAAPFIAQIISMFVIRNDNKQEKSTNKEK